MSVSNIRADTCIIGGGGAGAYAALRLHQHNKTVVVVEQSSHLGGHAQIYQGPASNNLPIDYGLGFEGLPDPVPEELVAPFGSTMRKYRLEAAVDDLGRSGGTSIRARVATERQIAELYRAMAARSARTLLLFNSRVVRAMERDPDDGRVVLDVVTSTTNTTTPTTLGKDFRRTNSRQRIRAKTVLIAVLPLPENLEPFLDPNGTEQALFAQFKYACLYSGVLQIEGLPPNVGYENRGVDDPFLLPHLPGILVMRPTRAPNVYTVMYGSPRRLSEEAVKREIREGLRSIHRKIGGNVSELEFLVLADHSPYGMRVSEKAIAGGFYQQLAALQGRRRLYYTG
ncbi:uncharacterized protein BO97DRAFT_428546 [Aspergillus homomorphus CBS 101889]|uniref:FAD/NAD(P)-binding domain-containing protein n=1 Tax=Aspergillus homomorphus (strain CBS 101889) TaxID=1450537 RepID=A0A395HJX7_ASPHC|nr:hypothetical protein BO97DRAFT_428546 [Aspergillus homomorphus CBS 101889]RAL08242.1 hypothetical protein BO97DRAFT_428546 [Aspergillus homomorphus CBS 101889]